MADAEMTPEIQITDFDPSTVVLTASGGLNVDPRAKVAVQIAELAAHLRKPYFFDDIIYTLPHFGDGTKDDLLKNMHSFPPSSGLKDPKVVTRYLQHNCIPIIEKRGGGEIVIAVDGGTGKVSDVGQFTEDLKPFLEKAFGAEYARVRLLILTGTEFVEIQKYATDAGALSKFLKSLSPELEADRAFHFVVNRAIERRASDIHIEPRADGTYAIRYRIDGDLQPAGERIASEKGRRLVNVIKIKSKLKTDEHRAAQDGSITLTGKDISEYPELEGFSLRVAVLPTADGEQIIMRIFAPTQASNYKLDNLGLSEKQLGQLRRIAKLPYGVVLVSGPTGSGKTTTLYASLQECNTPDTKIITIEDPVEAKIVGISQCPVNRAEKVQFDFHTGLRAILRADPDIILVGEVRDFETAQVMVHAALTGHLVFSTIHTLDAFAVLDRLIKNFNVDKVLLQNSLLAVVAQRLVRKVCPECVEAYDARADINQVFGVKLFPEVDAPQPTPLPLDQDSDAVVMYRPMLTPNPVCPCCDGTGYHGQVVVPEIWEIGTEEQDMISRGVEDRAEYMKVALSKGFEPMAMVGLGLALEGKTSLAQLTSRVFIASNLREHAALYKEYILKNRRPLQVVENSDEDTNPQQRAANE